MRKAVTLSIFLLVSLFIPSTYAQQDPYGSVNPPAYIGAGADAVQNFIPTLTLGTFIVGIIGLIAYLAYGAIKWITAGGEVKAIAAARDTITQAIIGFILLFIAFAVTLIANALLGGAIIPEERVPIYICGFQNDLGPSQPGCTDPTKCSLCSKPRYYIVKSKEGAIKNSSNYGFSKDGTICVSEAECNTGCLANDSMNRYVYCRPPNGFK